MNVAFQKKANCSFVWLICNCNKLAFPKGEIKFKRNFTNSNLFLYSYKNKFNNNINYYELLQVPFSATKSDIKKNFYELSKRYHPDMQRSKDDKSNQDKYLKITEAYDVLSDDKKRSDYDLKIGINNSNSSTFGTPGMGYNTTGPSYSGFQRASSSRRTSVRESYYVNPNINQYGVESKKKNGKRGNIWENENENENENKDNNKNFNYNNNEIRSNYGGMSGSAPHFDLNAHLKSRSKLFHKASSVKVFRGSTIKVGDINNQSSNLHNLQGGKILVHRRVKIRKIDNDLHSYIYPTIFYSFIFVSLLVYLSLWKIF